MDVDMRLARLAAEGGKEAFEALFDRHSGFVWSVALRMTGDPSHAEDLAQEVFLTVWRKLPQFEGRSSFTSWLYRITVNTALNWRRTQDRYQSFPEEGPARLDNLPSSSTGPEAQAMASQEEKTLETLLLSLEEPYRIAFILRELEGLSYEEVAKALGLPIGTVRSRLSRAREKLTKLAEGMGMAP